jgi:hypothetical protein
MNRIDNRTITKMEIALEKACRVFPNGGDHESRKYIAEQLRLSARKGNTTLDGLAPWRIAWSNDCPRGSRPSECPGLSSAEHFWNR